MMKIMTARYKSGNPFIGCVYAMAVLVCFVAPIPSHSQTVGGSLSGTITDESHGAIPKATVTIENIATAVTTTVTTNDQGIYNAPNLLPGAYQATISAPGFQNTVQKGIILTVGAQQVLNISMEVGSVSQTVEVTTEAPDVQLASSTINGSVSSNTIAELPLNGRSWTDLATLQPGVASVHEMVEVTSHDRLGRGLGNELSIDGGRPQQNNYLMNGISINDYSNQAPGSIMGQNLGADAVSEFTILTSNYSTEYGRSSGGVISAITRSGTNQFHGSAYEYFRNSALDAANFFDTLGKPEFRRNQFGVSAGGPIQKDNTFIFGDYEGLRAATGLSIVNQVPSVAARQGILSNCTPTPDPRVMCGPSPTGLVSCPAGTTLFVPNVSNVCVSNSVLPWIQTTNGNPPLYPLPNCGSSCAAGDTADFIPSESQVNSDNYFTIRVDHRFSCKDSVAGTYMLDNAPFSQPDAFNNILESSQTKRQVVSAEETHLFSGTLVNTLRFGWSHIYAAAPSGASAINPAAGVVNSQYSFITGDTTGGILGTTGLSDLTGGLSTALPAYFHWDSFQIYDNVYLTKGIHSLKFGANVERIKYEEFGCGNCGGNFAFSGLQDFLLNNAPTSFVGDKNPVDRNMRETLFGAYVQDDIRFRPNLTINVGLRYEMATVPQEVTGAVASLHSLDGTQMFAASLASLGPSPLPNCSTTVTANCLPPGVSPTTSPLFKNPSRLDFEPRVGFSWDPFRDGKTAVRAGFGMFDVQIFPSNLRGSVGAYPFGIGLFSGNLGAGSFPGPATLTIPQDSSQQHAIFVEQNPKRNYVMQWNLNIQRQIAPNTTVMIAYAGSRGVHNLLQTDDSSIVLPMKTPEGYLWPCGPGFNAGVLVSCAPGYSPAGTLANPIPSSVINPNFGRVSLVAWASDSIYHALEAQISKRMSHGLEAQISYTYGNSMDTSSGSTDGDQFQNGISSLFFFDRNARRGPSDFNIRNVFTASYNWEIPSPKNASGALGWVSSGWELGGVIEASNGAPFTPLIGFGSDTLGMGGTDPYDYANLVPGCNPIHGGVNYLNLQCFSLPTAPSSLASQCVDFPNAPAPPPGGQVYCANLLGNAGRNSLVGPTIFNVDMSLFKNNHIKRISETFNAQFRVEVFNILNHPNFNVPSASNTGIFDSTGVIQNAVNGGTAGVITSALATTSRQIQIAMKFTW